MTEDAVRSHAWIPDALGELVAAAPSMHKRPPAGGCTQGNRDCLSSGRVSQDHHRPSQLDTAFGAGKWNRLDVAKGRTLPSLWFMLMVCSQMRISPLQLVRGEIDRDDSAAATTKAAADIRLERPPVQPSRIDPVVIHHALEAVLADEPPPWMRPVADRLGEKYAKFHQYFPNSAAT